MKNIASKKWFYPVIYGLIFLITMLPLYTEKPYDPRNTQDVIMSVLTVSVEPYRANAPLIKGVFLLMVLYVAIGAQNAGRLMSAFLGVDYLLLSMTQNAAQTDAYGFAILTGNMLLGALLGLTWLYMTWRGKMEASYRGVPRWRWWLLPLALLAFWGPYRAAQVGVAPDFSPALLLTSPDFGMTFCFSTPVFLFFLILFYPNVSEFPFRITAFSGLLFGVYNLIHWFTPGMAWMGFLHLPLLLLSLVALFLPRIEKKFFTKDQEPALMQP